MLLSCTEESGESSYPDYPYGEELSTVEGVSIVKVRPTSSRGYVSNPEKIDAHGITLLTGLGIATETYDPIVVKKDLPEGQYDIYVRAESLGREAVAELVCRAYSEAFGFRVTRRMIELDAIVMTCPDREAISLETGTEEEGFWRHEELEDSARRTYFSSTADNLAKFAGYMFRNLAKNNDLPDRKARLRQVLVNETGIDGFLKGSLVWDAGDPERVKSSLRELGFTLTPARRTVPAIVVEPEMAGEEWSYFSESEMEAESPATESPASEGNLTDSSR